MDKVSGISLKAYGKINLSLDITGRREDGYHYIISLMQDIDVADDISMELINHCENFDQAGEIQNKKNNHYRYCFIKDIAIDFCTKQNTIPTGPGNLALQGARAVLEVIDASGADIGAIKEAGGIRIVLDKKLPVAAGLAGGSADAAVCMLGLNEIAGSPLSLSELMNVGIKVGSDVPYSLMMNAARNEAALKVEGVRSRAGLVGGMGERVEPCDPEPFDIVMMNPGISVSTGDIYEAVDRRDPDAGFRCADHAPCVTGHSGIKRFFNIMEECVLNLYPEAAAIHSWMRDNLRSDHLMMSGSGSTMIAYYNDGRAADEDYRIACEAAAAHAGWRAWRTKSGGK